MVHLYPQGGKTAIRNINVESSSDSSSIKSSLGVDILLMDHPVPALPSQVSAPSANYIGGDANLIRIDCEAWLVAS